MRAASPALRSASDERCNSACWERCAYGAGSRRCRSAGHSVKRGDCWTAMKLLTWNVQWCRGVDGRVDPARIARTARAFADFDVLCLQEVAVHFPGLPGSGGEDQMAALSAALPGYTPLFGVATELSEVAGHRRQFGNAVFTRLPVLQVFRHLLPWPADPAVQSMQRMALEVGAAVAGRSAARDQHAPGVLLGASARGPGGAPAPPAPRSLHACPAPAPRRRSGQPLRSASAPGLGAAVRRLQLPSRQPRVRSASRAPLRR